MPEFSVGPSVYVDSWPLVTLIINRSFDKKTLLLQVYDRDSTQHVTELTLNVVKTGILIRISTNWSTTVVEAIYYPH